jgi:hypothetical protein
MPQLLGSTEVLVQSEAELAQTVLGAAQMVLHAPPEHTWPDGHATPQPPQLAASLRVRVSQPLAALPSQLAKPALQAVTAQAFAAQALVALASTQGRPQAPQLADEVASAVSQPSAATPLQSPKPAAQVTTVHPPAEQPATVALASAQTRPHVPQLRGSIVGSVQKVAGAVPHTTLGAAQVVRQAPAAQLWPAGHATPQPPQLALLLRVSTSQPSAAAPLQLAKPVAQAPAGITHAPFTHDCVVTLGSAQAAPHAPQLAAPVTRLASQPSGAAPLQSPLPAAQRSTVHAPAAQPATATEGSAQPAPQAPQFAGSTAVLAQYEGAAPTAGQVASGAAQVVPHAPPEHTWPAPHATPQPPQLALSVRTFTSQPSEATPSQSAKPGAQAASPQVPPAQADVALGSAQARPQAPQLALLLWRLVSQPLAAAPSQSPEPALHAITVHAPAAQPLAATEGSAQARPHAPQWSGSIEVLAQKGGAPPTAGQVARGGAQVVPHAPPEQTWPAAQVVRQAPQLALSLRVSTSQPLAASPSQSAKPGLQAATPQAPPAQAAAALGSAQTRPQAPQLAAVVSSAASQPLAAAPSQSPKPAAQRTTVQAPPRQPLAAAPARAQTVPQAPQLVGSTAVLVQNAVAPAPQVVLPAPQVAPQAPAEQTWPAAHAAPHDPQLALSVRVLVSQPSAATPLQSAKPAAQAPAGTTHAPATHAWVVTLGSAQAAPQAPQLVAAVWVSASQPSAATPLQSPKPAAQRTMLHTPAVQPAVVVLGGAQTVPQAPQLAGSMEVLAHWLTPPSPPQVTSGAAQVVPHAPPEQTWPAAQVVPHDPQLALSVWRLAHPPPQTARPAPHEAAQTPAAHDWPAGQAVPHAPQLALSVWRLAQAAPQAAWPAGQESWQAPPTQALPAGQALPHAPQLSRSVAVLAQ